MSIVPPAFVKGKTIGQWTRWTAVDLTLSYFGNKSLQHLTDEMIKMILWSEADMIIQAPRDSWNGVGGIMLFLQSAKTNVKLAMATALK